MPDFPVASASWVCVKSAEVQWSDSRFCRIPAVKVISDIVVSLLVTGRTGLHLLYVPVLGGGFSDLETIGCQVHALFRLKTRKSPYYRA